MNAWKGLTAPPNKQEPATWTDVTRTFGADTVAEFAERGLTPEQVFTPGQVFDYCNLAVARHEYYSKTIAAWTFVVVILGGIVWTLFG